MMNASLGWALQRDAQSVKVCAVDSGVAWTHPDLAAALVAMPDAYKAANTDGFGHGTHVAGIIGAVRWLAAAC
jgi:subtilisin